MKIGAMRAAALEALKSAAFEERVNKCPHGAYWWRERAAMWFRREAEATRLMNAPQPLMFVKEQPCN